MKKDEIESVKLDDYVMASFSAWRRWYIGINITVENLESITSRNVESQIECAGIVDRERNIMNLCIYRTGLGDFNIFSLMFLRIFYLLLIVNLIILRLLSVVISILIY